MIRQRLCLLGATGSVGSSTLDVIARHPERFEVYALSAQGRVDEMAALCRRWVPTYAVMGDADAAQRLRVALSDAKLPTEVLEGPRALCEIAAHAEVDIVMGAIVGAAGLEPCLAAARAGKRLLLANKEALVLGGALFMRAVREGGATLLPIDSEHSAIFQCLPEDQTTWAERIDHIVLTASGGPFRTRRLDTLAQVTVQEACAHPNWVMGRKISVDSATMMNKALEVIEARWLFNLDPANIRVVVHPQSIIHSMVVCRDHSVLAQLGTPDMRVPISVGLAYPQRLSSGAEALDFTRLQSLTFEEPDARRFPGLGLAWSALAGPLGSTAVLNAANEVAVEAFLCGRIGFTQIHAVNADVLAAVDPALPEEAGVADLLDLDARVRTLACERVTARAA